MIYEMISKSAISGFFLAIVAYVSGSKSWIKHILKGGYAFCETEIFIPNLQRGERGDKKCRMKSKGECTSLCIHSLLNTSLYMHKLLYTSLPMHILLYTSLYMHTLLYSSLYIHTLLPMSLCVHIESYMALCMSTLYMAALLYLSRCVHKLLLRHYQCVFEWIIIELCFIYIQIIHTWIYFYFILTLHWWVSLIAYVILYTLLCRHFCMLIWTHVHILTCFWTCSAVWISENIDLSLCALMWFVELILEYRHACICHISFRIMHIFALFCLTKSPSTAHFF